MKNKEQNYEYAEKTIGEAKSKLCDSKITDDTNDDYLEYELGKIANMLNELQAYCNWKMGKLD